MQWVYWNSNNQMCKSLLIFKDDQCVKLFRLFVGKLYGRGSTDDKGPVLAWFNCIEAYEKTQQVQLFNPCCRNQRRNFTSALLVDEKKNRFATVKCFAGSWWNNVEHCCRFCCTTFGFCLLRMISLECENINCGFQTVYQSESLDQSENVTLCW